MIIDGKKIAEEMLTEVAERVKAIQQAQGKPPRLMAVLVGDIKGSSKFLELKKKAAEKAGIEFEVYEFTPDITTQKLLEDLRRLANNSTNQGIMIELPLPAQIDAKQILNIIPQEKDVDVLSERSQESFFSGESPVLPPAVVAVKTIFSAISGPASGEGKFFDVRGKNCAVFGQGLLVGKPVSYWLEQNGATVARVDEFTINPELYSLNADIIISGVGKPNIIKGDMVKEGVIVIDFGYENIGGKPVGDVAFEEVSKKASLITPVPGGVGPIDVAAVLKNLLTLVKLK